MHGVHDRGELAHEGSRGAEYVGATLRRRQVSHVMRHVPQCTNRQALNLSCEKHLHKHTKKSTNDDRLQCDVADIRHPCFNLLSECADLNQMQRDMEWSDHPEHTSLMCAVE